jgi:hypothetical protein
MIRISMRFNHRGWLGLRITMLLLSLIASFSVLFLFTSAKVYHYIVMVYAPQLPVTLSSTYMSNDYPSVYTFYNLLQTLTSSSFLSTNLTIILPMLFICYSITLHTILMQLLYAYLEYRHFEYNPKPWKVSHNIFFILIVLWLCLIYWAQNTEVFHVFAKLLIGYCQSDYLPDFRFVARLKDINFLAYYSIFCLAFFPTSAPYGYFIIPIVQFSYALLLHFLLVCYRHSV